MSIPMRSRTSPVSTPAVDVSLEDGRVARMRPARVADELRALEDFRVWLRPDRLSSVLLARVVVEIGDVAEVDVGLLESLSSTDRQRLECAYVQLNGYEASASDSADERERGSADVTC